MQWSGFTGEAFKPGLDAMRAYDTSLGHPHKAYRTIHVAGTNGKGSVCSMIAASLAGSGFRVGLYTSPHILDFRERIKLVSADGYSMISREDVTEFLQSHDEPGLTFFEITTGMALWWFRRMDVDFAVIEVGLGGRLDATNIITPVLSVVTSIGLDHCAILGDTRERIAAEKAGIFKDGVPALVWGHDPQTDSVFLARSADLHFASSHEHPATDLAGEYESANLDTAISALELLGIAPCLPAIARTAALTGFSGRWDLVHRSPDVICDIGHNPAALALNFRQLESDARDLHIVYGIMADKDLDGIAPLFPSRARYYLCAPETQRALGVDNLYARLRALRPDLDLRPFPTVEDAVRAAMDGACPGGLVYAGGSTFVVGETMRLFKSH